MSKGRSREWKHNSLFKGVLLASSLFLLTACSIFPQEEKVLAPPLVKPAKVEYDTAKVKRGTIVKKVEGTGNFIAVKDTDLYFTKNDGVINKIEVKNGDTVKKGQVLLTLDTGNLATQIALQKIQVEKANLNLKKLTAANADEYTLDMAKLDKQAADIQLNELNNQMAQAQLKAPADGVITMLTSKDSGESVKAYESLVKVVDPHVLQFLYTALNSQALNDVVLGMPATITLSNGKKIKGKVVQTPETAPVDLPKEQADKYKRSVLIKANDIPKSVKMGDAASMEIPTKEKKNTLLIPKQALRTFSSQSYVQILDGDSKKEIDVKVGLQNETEVEILNGLNEGDQVILK